jgi:SAM-dependent methyltransferase
MEVGMTKPNYESIWWGYIYDQMMEGDLSEQLDETRRFFQRSLSGVTGPVLECACGTGLIMLPLLAQGYDMYGFDISHTMLSTLRKKAAAQGLADIDARISIQDLQTFSYDLRFDAITIPTNTFLMLMTQEAQIQSLRQIVAHLAPGGRLLIELQLTGMRGIDLEAMERAGQWHTWVHPETGQPIRQRMVGRVDLHHQQTLDQCCIEYAGEAVDFPMTGRWMFKEEFQLLLRLAGFTRWEAYSTPDGDPLQVGLDDQRSYWSAWVGRDSGERAGAALA